MLEFTLDIAQEDLWKINRCFLCYILLSYLFAMYLLAVLFVIINDYRLDAKATFCKDFCSSPNQDLIQAIRPVVRQLRTYGASKSAIISHLSKYKLMDTELEEVFEEPISRRIDHLLVYYSKKLNTSQLFSIFWYPLYTLAIFYFFLQSMIIYSVISNDIVEEKLDSDLKKLWRTSSKFFNDFFDE
uniref:Calcium permeable stress-gated cation channel 1 n=1 Tax=Bursaphelenchus xylophilus TaxID=6326 RepID=A0A1I7SDZ3_BURXY